jgi:uncharacterized protein (DUF2252 family)
VVTAAAQPTDTGKAARAHAPRSSHARWEPPQGRPDPVALLELESEARVPDLVPIRYSRMAISSFAFFRGAAGIMASDLAGTPVSGTRVQLCGDAHLMNFGGFGSAERSLVFDLNDFDETLPGPWEWDVKRLAASIAIAGRERGFAEGERAGIVRHAVREYRRAMRNFARMPALEVWYARLDERILAEQLYARASSAEAKRFERNVARARAKDSSRAFAKLAYRMNGGARIAADPPLITPVEDLAAPAQAERINEMMQELVGRYRSTLPPDRRHLLDRYDYVHAARKVVGVGSVGTRAWVLLFLGRDHGDPLFLQAKEAEESALAPYAGASRYDHQGRRVVEGQRLMQAAGDIFLGWLRAEGVDGKTRDFYVRQLWDWKASADVDRMSTRMLDVYGRLCAWTLARAHARTGDARSIAAYLGSGDSLDRALAAFAEAYGDQNERDYGAFVTAIGDGRIAADAASTAA